MDTGIARAELHYVMAYQALSQVENPASLRAEANALVGQINDACGLPATGHLYRLSSAQQVACITGKFEAERGRLLFRLQGGALSEARLTPEQAMAIQRTLKAEGLLGINDAVDGVFGPATRVAIRNWQRVRGLPETGFGSTAILAAPVATVPFARTATAPIAAAPVAPTPAAPAPAAFSASALGDIVTTSQANEIRFNRDYKGRSFHASMKLRGVSDSFTKGRYHITFTSAAGVKVGCFVSDPATPDKAVEWNPGQTVEVSGVIDDTTFGNLNLSKCVLNAVQ